MAEDPSLATNIMTIADCDRLVDWAVRNGMTFREVLSSERAYLSFAFDHAWIIDADWLTGLQPEDLEHRAIFDVSSDGMSFSVVLRGLTAGTNLPSDHLSRLFTVSGTSDLKGEFTPANV